MASTEPLPAEVAALDGMALNELISRETGSAVPVGLAALGSLPRRFSTVVDASKDGVESSVLGWLQEK